MIILGPCAGCRNNLQQCAKIWRPRHFQSHLDKDQMNAYRRKFYHIQFEISVDGLPPCSISFTPEPEILSLLSISSLRSADKLACWLLFSYQPRDLQVRCFLPELHMPYFGSINRSKNSTYLVPQLDYRDIPIKMFSSDVRHAHAGNSM